MAISSRMTGRITRREALRTGAGVLGLLAACVVPATAALASAEGPATPSLRGPALQGDTNSMGWPTSISNLVMGFIPLEDQVQQKASWQPFLDHMSQKTGVPVEMAITTSYTALVEAQRGMNAHLGYYGALSFLLAEQQINAVPIMVDSTDGVNPGSYYSMLMAGKDSPVKTVQDIRGQDFTFVDPASTSGNLFPRVMLLEEGIDPNTDIKGRFAGNHQNSILAVAKGQVPCGASNNLSLEQAVSNGVIAREEINVLKESDPIPNGPFAVHPELDPRAVEVLKSAMASFTADAAAYKKLGLVGPLIPAKTEAYDFVRRAAKVINLQFDEKGNVKPIGE
jgi:phosphonate transport system substrate-binding protein